MSSTWMPYCVFCKHFDSEKLDQEHLRHCKVFGGEIPNDIIEGKVDHRQPYEGDNGIQFEFQDDMSKLPWLLKDQPIEGVKKFMAFSFYDARFAHKQREQEAKKDTQQTDDANE